MRDYKVTKKSGELYNCEVVDSHGKEYQNWFDTEQECINWIYYIWENENKVVDSNELLSKAISNCIELDIKRGVEPNLD